MVSKDKMHTSRLIFKNALLLIQIPQVVSEPYNILSNWKTTLDTHLEREREREREGVGRVHGPTRRIQQDNLLNYRGNSPRLIQ